MPSAETHDAVVVPSKVPLRVRKSTVGIPDAVLNPFPLSVMVDGKLVWSIGFGLSVNRSTKNVIHENEAVSPGFKESLVFTDSLHRESLKPINHLAGSRAWDTFTSPPESVRPTKLCTVPEAVPRSNSQLVETWIPCIPPNPMICRLL